MPQDQFAELRRMWEEHVLEDARNALTDQIKLILKKIELSSLAPQVKNTLIKFYSEILALYATETLQELINKSQFLKEYTGSDLQNHNETLIAGILADAGLHQTDLVTEVSTLLNPLLTNIKAQAPALMKALQSVIGYAEPPRNDGEFFSPRS
jgi:vacuolar-type H+-ATPase subunit E/Vma4